MSELPPQSDEPTGTSSAEPTQQFTQPLHPSGGFGGYPGPTGPPPSPWTQPAETSAVPAPRQRGRLGLVAGVAATALIVGGGAGFGGAALYHQNSSNDGTIFSGTASHSSNAVATDAPKGSVEAVAATVLPSVVKIEVSGSQESGSGSGIILSSDGEILTNNHVVALAGNSGKIQIDFNDGSKASATVMGTDPLTDTAVVKASGVSGLKPATIGHSDALKVGQSVVAIGSPFGLDSTVTSGIVSALNRPVDVGSDSSGNATVYPAIQTDAAINPGNSGGALVNMSGQVVGINASIQTAGSTTTDGESGSIGLGFAIPIDEVGPVIQQMIKGETPTHARLGIQVQNVGASTSSNNQQQSPGQGQGGGGGLFGFPFGDGSGGSGGGGGNGGGQQSAPAFSTDGAQIADVSSGSTAEKAGLKKGDIITKVNDQLISDSDSLVATIRSYRPGDKVTLTYTRGGKTSTVTLTLDSDASSTKS